MWGSKTCTQINILATSVCPHIPNNKQIFPNSDNLYCKVIIAYLFKSVCINYTGVASTKANQIITLWIFYNVFEQE